MQPRVRVQNHTTVVSLIAFSRRINCHYCSIVHIFPLLLLILLTTPRNATFCSFPACHMGPASIYRPPPRPPLPLPHSGPKPSYQPQQLPQFQRECPEINTSCKHSHFIHNQKQEFSFLCFLHTYFRATLSSSSCCPPHRCFA